jgi:hypothetical protein
MKRVLCGLVALGLFLGSVGQARSDSIRWSDFNGGKIRRANLDGSGLETLVEGLASPALLALDFAGGLMYWTNAGSGDIRRANLDGSGEQTLITGLSRPGFIALVK